MVAGMLLKNNADQAIFITSNIKKQEPEQGGKKNRIEEHIKMYDNSKVTIIQRKNSRIPLIKYTGMKHLYYINYDNDQNQPNFLIIIKKITDRRRIWGVLIKNN